MCIVKTVAGWGGRSNIRCVYIYITIYTYIPTYTTPIDAFVDFMPYFHRSGSLLATKAEKN